jgi:hypothetical protein
MALLFKMRFDSGDQNVWTGIGDLTFNSDTYQGLGNLITVSNYRETQTLRAEGMAFTLSGNIAANLSTALTEEFQGRVCTLWVAFFDNDVSPGMLNDPLIIFQGRMDTMEIDHGSEQSLIELRAENVLVSLEHASNRRYTPDDHNIGPDSSTFTDANGVEFFDKGFDQVSILEDKEIVWGRPNPSTGGP